MFYESNDQRFSIRIRIRILFISHHIEWVCSHDSCEREEEREGLEVDVEAAQRVADRAARVLRLPKQNLKKQTS